MANHRDPLLYVARTNPPVYDIAENREGWRRWKTDWEDYQTLSGLDNFLTDNYERTLRAQKLRIASFRKGLSDETKRIVDILPLTDAQRRDPEDIIAALNTHLDGGTSQRVYRKQLATRVRHEGEDLDAFLTDIDDITRKCKFKALASDALAEEERKFDTLVSNINDKRVTEKLLAMVPTATYADAVTLVRATLAARQDAEKFTGAQAPAAAKFTGQPGRTGSSKRCPRCGYGAHPAGKKCPADDQTCHHCQQRGHFNRCCPSNKDKANSSRPAANTVANSSGPGDAEDATVHSLNFFSLQMTESGGADALPARTGTFSQASGGGGNNTGTGTPAATIVLTFSGRPDPLEQLENVVLEIGTKKKGSAPGEGEHRAKGVSFLPDTGANVTAIRPRDLDLLRMNPSDLACRNPPPAAPTLADGSTTGLRPLGVFRAALYFPRAKTVIQCDIWVVKGLKQPILSRQACFQLGIIRSPHLRGGGGQTDF